MVVVLGESCWALDLRDEPLADLWGWEVHCHDLSHRLRP